MDVPAAISRVLRAPWEGGFRTIARGAGFDRLESCRDAGLSPTCFAPAPAEAFHNPRVAPLRRAA
jgi:hypothetical protein